MQQIQEHGRDGTLPLGEPPSELVVITAPGQSADPVLELLRRAGLGVDSASSASGAPGVVKGFELANSGDLPAQVTRGPNVHLLVLFHHPRMYIAGLLEEGLGPRDALARWQQGAEILLAVARRSRRRSTLLPLEMAFVDPVGFVRAIGSRLSVELDASEAGEPVPETPSAMCRMMAENAVWQSSQSRQLAAELEASALPISSAVDLDQPAIDLVYDEYCRNLDSYERLSREREEEKGLLLAQLNQVQQELENRYLAEQEKDQQLKNAEEKIAQGNPNDPKLKDLEKEKDLLVQQLLHVQEELERYYLENQDLMAKLKKTQTESTAHEKLALKNQRQIQRMQSTIDNKQRRIDYMLGSRSWKITAPMRRLIKLSKGSGNNGK